MHGPGPAPTASVLAWCSPELLRGFARRRGIASSRARHHLMAAKRGEGVEPVDRLSVASTLVSSSSWSDGARRFRLAGGGGKCNGGNVSRGGMHATAPGRAPSGARYTVQRSLGLRDESSSCLPHFFREPWWRVKEGDALRCHTSFPPHAGDTPASLARVIGGRRTELLPPLPPVPPARCIPPGAFYVARGSSSAPRASLPRLRMLSGTRWIAPPSSPAEPDDNP